MKQIPKVVLNRQEQHSAFSECVAVLESNQVQYFPSRGTLIGLVRYGDLQGKLSGFKVDVVDRDMDWMVHVDSADSWFHLAQQISASLLDKGWHSCQLTVASEVLCLGEIHSMKCIRIEPYVASVDFDAYHLLPGRLCLGFRDEQLSSPYRRCAETAETAVDRGAETGAAGAARRCFGAQEVFPLQKCRAPVVGSVPCPRDPVAYLAQLYDAETSAALTASRARRCWALPSITESRAPNDPRNQLLRQQGLNGSDVALLRRSAEELHGEGYASFREELERCNVSSEALEDVMQGSFGKWSLLRKSSKVAGHQRRAREPSEGGPVELLEGGVHQVRDVRILAFSQEPLLRAMQLLRIIRIAKLIGLRQELVAIMEGLFSSLECMVWIGFLLLIAIYSFGIVCRNVMGDLTNADFEHVIDNDMYFGTLPRTMLTLFNIALIENWAAVIWPQMLYNPWMVLPLIFFMCVTCFGLMNALIGVIVERTTAAQQNMSSLEEEKIREMKMLMVAQLLEAIDASDEDESGTINLQEFRQVQRKPYAAQIFAALNLPPGFEAKDLFGLLDADGDGVLDRYEFLLGICRLIWCDDFQSKCLMSYQISQVREEGRRRRQASRCFF
ncbi:Voltage-dependent T-type calcium channel subunit alpha-1I (Voltage-gated calcium channel subunit alpha Cav3.3) (Ca(v)3.3) [Durusdinium trenchii]|uniref:Voltage-dependent T-type calcium channel subunit alpha-1I (Voltage-gated calcium channel subunit alpha Cav3.3) (Ca(V)3.3) n=1 Tax=Durusdinium trenchii TaxID=1381693 RepID=A0ABP0PB36_9DINO